MRFIIGAGLLLSPTVLFAQAEGQARVTQAAGLTSSQIQSAISEHRQDVRSCVFNDREGLPTVVELTVQFNIATDGGVDAVTMHESNAGKDSVDDCILAVVQNVQFPPVDGGRPFAVRYKFTFVVGS